MVTVSSSPSEDKDETAKDSVVNYSDKLIIELQKQTQNKERPRSDQLRSITLKPQSETIDEKIRKQQIENNNRESDQKLKTRSLVILFIFLAVETIAVFLLAFAQGLKFGGFFLDEWSLRITIVATLGQITAMLTIAIKHLFPSNIRK